MYKFWGVFNNNPIKRKEWDMEFQHFAYAERAFFLS